MPVLSGPELEAMKKRLVTWYAKTRQDLIEALEQGAPYGSTELTPDEQVNQYLNMTEADWVALKLRLEERFRGLPDMAEKVQGEINRFVTHMNLLIARRRSEFGGTFT